MLHCSNVCESALNYRLANHELGLTLKNQMGRKVSGTGGRRARRALGGKYTREQVLEVAAKLFRTQGYSATTLRQIAETAGIQAGSIYYHFGSKDEILQEILETGVNVVQGAVEERLRMLPAGCSARQKIEAATEGHLSGLFKLGDFTSATIRIYGQLPPELQRVNRIRRARYSAVWDGLFKEALERGELRGDIDLHVARLLVIGALNWTVEWYDPEQGDYHALTQMIATIICSGIFRPSALPGAAEVPSLPKGGRRRKTVRASNGGAGQSVPSVDV